MYDTSNIYKEKILENNRVFKLDIRIEHLKGTLKLTDKDVAQNTLVFEDATQSGDDFTVGGTFASNIDFTLVNRSEYENINFTGAKVYVDIGMLVGEAIDAHFIQPTQPSKMVDFDDPWEYVPLGEFNIDDVNRLRSTIEIRAIDNMILLDKSYEHSNLAYPATLKEIFLDICQKADVTPGTTSFVNDNYSVPEPPKEKDNLSFRNILGYLAEISGSYAKFNREGHLELRWYEETDLVLTPDQRSSFKDKDYEVQITGVVFDTEEEFENEEGETEREEVRYMSGTDEYAINLSDNELLQDDYDTLLPNILNRIDKVKFTPTEGEFNGNPAIESGDMITHEDIDGNIINTVVTHSSYKYRGRHTIKGEGKHNLSRDFKSTDNRIAHIIDRVEENLGDEINNLEQAQLNATELIANTLGGFITEIRVEADPDYEEFGIGKFVHDAPQLRDSTKIWKWGLGGFGYSDDGGETYTTAITKDGSIVANLITANMVQTGVLRSLNNKTVMDLDNGTFRLGNEMIFDGETLNMGGNTSISWGNITDNSHIPSRDEIPSSPGDIGAKPDWWLPEWSDVSNKPYIPDDNYITTISRNAITTEFLRSKKLTVGDEVIMGSNAKITWSNVTSKPDVAEKSDIPSEHFITTITKDTVESENFKYSGSFTGYVGSSKAIKMSNNQLDFYDWQSSGSNVVGSIASSRSSSYPERTGVTINVEYGDAFSIGYKRDSSYPDFMEFNTTYSTYPIRIQEDLTSNSTIRVSSANRFRAGTESYIMETNRSLLLRGHNTNGVSIGTATAGAVIDADPATEGLYPIALRRSVKAFGNLHVEGNTSGFTLNSLSSTSNYGVREMSTFNTTEAHLGDIGSGVINDNGECLVYIDDVFKEAANTNIKYHVFTQGYGGKINNIERESEYFIVFGEPGTKFSWEIKAKKVNTEHERLELQSVDGEVQPVSFEEELNVDDKFNNKTLGILESDLVFKLDDYLLSEGV